jgi:hypothetical protein
MDLESLRFGAPGRALQQPCWPAAYLFIASSKPDRYFVRPIRTHAFVGFPLRRCRDRPCNSRVATTPNGSSRTHASPPHKTR